MCKCIHFHVFRIERLIYSCCGLYSQPCRLEETRRDVEEEATRVGLLDRRHARLHRARSVHAARLQQLVRLVVAGRHHVRDAHRLPALLLRGRPDHLPQGDAVARHAHLSARGAHLVRGPRSHYQVIVISTKVRQRSVSF